MNRHGARLQAIWRFKMIDAESVWLTSCGAAARPVAASSVVGLRFSDESMPGPLRDVQTVRYILGRVVVMRHRGRGSPREVIVQDTSQPLVAREPDIFQRQIETRDRSLVHLLVQPVPAVNPHDRGLITTCVGIGVWPAKCLSPVR